MRRLFLGIMLLAVCPFLAAQQALNNDGVINLVRAGLSDDLIISTIGASAGNYDTSANGLIAMKKAGASDRVISTIVLKGLSSASPTAASASAPGAASAAGNPDDPTAPHEAGIYIYSESAPPGSKMTMLEPSVYSEGKTGGYLAASMTYGIAKIKRKAVIRGAHSNARAADSQPVFYFYFEQRGAGLSQASTPFGGTSTPNEYTLLKFDIKGDTRETVVGTSNAFGTSGGTEDRAVTGFTYSKLRPGAYKVVLNGTLQPGEYGFISANGTAGMGLYGGSGASRVFDFGRN
jgi:hypothetical protein